MMENHDKGIQQIDTASLSHGLRMNIRNRTSRGICRMLIDRGASIEDRDEDMLTPMMACVYKEGVEPEIIAARLATLQLVIERGAKFETELTSGVTALCLACQNYFERAAHLLAERGARLQALSKWMKEPMNKNNWCSGSTFGKYIWGDRTEFGKKYSASLKEKFDKEFDKDGSGTLERDEMVTFIATHLKAQV